MKIYNIWQNIVNSMFILYLLEKYGPFVTYLFIFYCEFINM